MKPTVLRLVRVLVIAATLAITGSSTLAWRLPPPPAMTEVEIPIDGRWHAQAIPALRGRILEARASPPWGCPIEFRLRDGLDRASASVSTPRLTPLWRVVVRGFGTEAWIDPSYRLENRHVGLRVHAPGHPATRSLVAYLRAHLGSGWRWRVMPVAGPEGYLGNPILGAHLDGTRPIPWRESPPPEQASSPEEEVDLAWELRDEIDLDVTDLPDFLDLHATHLRWRSGRLELHRVFEEEPGSEGVGALILDRGERTIEVWRWDSSAEYFGYPPRLVGTMGGATLGPLQLSPEGVTPIGPPPWDPALAPPECSPGFPADP